MVSNGDHSSGITANSSLPRTRLLEVAYSINVIRTPPDLTHSINVLHSMQTLNVAIELVSSAKVGDCTSRERERESIESTGRAPRMLIEYRLDTIEYQESTKSTRRVQRGCSEND